MESKLKITRKNCKGITFAVFVFSYYSVFALPTNDELNLIGDSLNKNYSFTLPRNPKCPCQKIQKKAEREYRSLLKKTQKQVVMKANYPKSKFKNSRKTQKTSIVNWHLKISKSFKKRFQKKDKLAACPNWI